MTANPATDDDSHFSWIELDDLPSRQAPASVPDPMPLDMVDSPSAPCLGCGGARTVNELGLCESCAPVAAPAADVVADLTKIAATGAANAAVQSLGSLRGGQLAGVGFTSREGYIEAIRHGVKAATHSGYLTTLRTRYGMTTADIAALNLPGPMVESELPVGEGVAHVPAGHVAGSAGIFERKDRQFRVGDAPAEYQTLKPADLRSQSLVAVAKSEGHGCVIAWNGRRTVKRAELGAALTKIDAADLMPRANSARAQAGRTLTALNSFGQGYVVRVERRPTIKAGETAPTYDVRWTVGRVTHDAPADDPSLGKRVLQVTLTDDVLSFVGDEQLAASVLDGYQARLGEEIYQSADITSWLGGVLSKHFDAIAFGALGWYVPAKHTARAAEICQAVASIGFGAGWVLPGLPVTDGDILRDGILRGLTDEVDGLMERLATERAAAKATRESGDIGTKRAGSFLADLRKIGERVVAYALVLGDERVSTARERIRLAIADLEGLLSDEQQGITARFAAVWEEIEYDRKRIGGVL